MGCGWQSARWSCEPCAIIVNIVVKLDIHLNHKDRKGCTKNTKGKCGFRIVDCGMREEIQYLFRMLNT